MISAALFLGLMFFAVPGSDSAYPPNETDTTGTFCDHELSIETFATSFYTAMVVEYGFDVVAAIDPSGIDAAMAIYLTIDDILEKQGLCDADMIAFTASRAAAKLKSLPLSVYLEVIAHETAEFSKKNGLLDDCPSAIPLAFDFFKLVRKEFSGSDKNKFASYVHAVVQGLVDFIHEHGLDLDNSSNSLADMFVTGLSSKKQNTCPNSNN